MPLEEKGGGQLLLAAQPTTNGLSAYGVMSLDVLVMCFITHSRQCKNAGCLT